MMLTLFLVGIISFGEIREVFSRSLIPNVAIMPVFGEIDFRNPGRNPEIHLDKNVFSFIENQEELLDLRLQKYNMNQVDRVNFEPAQPPLDTISDEVEQSYLLVKTKTTRRHRAKRHNIQNHHSLCHFKICIMGRKRHIR